MARPDRFPVPPRKTVNGETGARVARRVLAAGVTEGDPADDDVVTGTRRGPAWPGW